MKLWKNYEIWKSYQILWVLKWLKKKVTENKFVNKIIE